MKVEIFTVADSVNVYGGKFVITGTFDIVGSPNIPFKYGPLGIGAKIIGEETDRGKKVPFKLTVNSKEPNENMLTIDGELSFGKTEEGIRPTAQFAAMLGIVEFKYLGVYELELFIDEQSIATKEIYVTQRK